jgi:hypothetical protein
MTNFTYEPQNTEQIETLARLLADICIKIITDTDHCEIASDTVARALFWAEHIVSEKSVIVSETLAKLHGELVSGNDDDGFDDDFDDYEEVDE